MINIAIDGPCGAGKSTVAKAVAKKLGILYLDTGAMYRCIGLKALNGGVDTVDEQSVKNMLDNTEVDVKYVDGVQRVFLDGADVTSEIREHSVSKAASDISAVPCVRYKMAEAQRAIAEKNDCILDGRDISSFVLPNANFKFYLTATPEIRATRRLKELAAKGRDLPYKQVLADVQTRDYNDSHRAVAPLVCVSDAIVIDSTEMTLEQVVGIILKVVGEKNRG